MKAQLPALGQVVRTLCFAALFSISFGSLAYEASGSEGGVIFGQTTTPGDTSFEYNFDGGFYGSSALVSVTSSPVASISVAGSAFNPNGQVALQAGGGLTYTFQVQAQPNTVVPIDFSGLYSSFQGSAHSLAFTSVMVRTVDSSVSTQSGFSSYFYGDCTFVSCLDYLTTNTAYTSTQSDASHVAGSFDGTLDMLTGADGTVNGMVLLSVAGYLDFQFGSRSVTSFIDPHLQIDAAFLAANPGATLTVEPGVGNDPTVAAPIPEASTYALMLAGLAALGVSARRVRRSSAGAESRES